MIAVLAAKSSNVEALMTTASLRPSPPETMATSEMKRSLWVALNSADNRWIDNRVNNGEVNSVVTITANIAQRAVRRSGKRMFGVN